MPNTATFRNALWDEFRRAEAKGEPYIDICSGDLHRQVGGYPGPNHRMPQCCDAMYGEQRASDDVLAAPRKRKGASLIIRYQLPR